MGALDGQILLWIQSLRTPLLNKFMVSFTQLGDHGVLFIAMALLLIAIPATRKQDVRQLSGWQSVLLSRVFY